LAPDAVWYTGAATGVTHGSGLSAVDKLVNDWWYRIVTPDVHIHWGSVLARRLQRLRATGHAGQQQEAEAGRMRRWSAKHLYFTLLYLYVMLCYEGGKAGAAGQVRYSSQSAPAASGNPLGARPDQFRISD
jgi:hypothetical protein